MPKIRIVQIIGNLSRGGAERFVVDLCNEMARNTRCEIYLVSLMDNGAEGFVKDLDPRVKYVSFRKQAGFSLKVFLKLTVWLRNLHPAVVHSHLNSSEYLFLYRLYSSRTLFFHTIHNVAREECPGFWLKNLRGIFYRFHKVKPITISENGRETYRTYYGLDNDILIENGRPSLKTTEHLGALSDRYKKYGSNFLLLHIGRISAEKNQEMLIKVVQKFNETEEVKCKLLLIGEIQDRPLYMRLIKLAAGDPNIEFKGAQQHIADYLSIADAFCLSSFFEGMPISLIEAMAVGCIPVCTPVGGMKEMISDGLTGFLSEDTRMESYELALKRALYSHQKQALKERIIRHFETHFHIEISAKKHLKTYQQLLDQREGPRSAFALQYESKFK